MDVDKNPKDAPMPAFQGAVVFTGGGTGGHFFPAVALAEALRARRPDLPIAFVGAQRGIEARKLPGGPWPHLLLPVEGFLGRSPLRAARSAWKLWRAVALLKARFRAGRPLAVVGTGGYAAAPALLAARALGIPYFLHESNAQPGALVGLVAPRARRVWCGMEAGAARLGAARLGKARTRLVGTPVRAAFLRDFRPAAELEAPFQLLVLGGSGGARALNEALLELAPALLEAHPDWRILHQAGPAEAERLSERPRHPRHELVPFIEGADEAMERSALVVSRAGASTCAELKACGRAALLVPLPGSAGDHQDLNARAMEDEGRALRVPQGGPDLPSRLAGLAGELMGNRERRLGLCRPEPNRAVELCLEDLEGLLGG